jgi:hypothetical protein
VAERALVDHGRQRSTLADRRDAADDVAGDPLGRSRLGDLRPLGPERGGHGLEVEPAVDGDDPHGGAGGGADEERLEDARRVDAQRPRRLEPVRLGGLVGLVGPRSEGDFRLGQRHDGRGAAGRPRAPAHGLSLTRER